ncbi:hypothetical protein DFJ73DRAFT_803092 [Zopfochytrium polystomum]|nr:hypothetical protein DFJ73DRAFT_803092 [Zopfochytrium polystomum]
MVGALKEATDCWAAICSYLPGRDRFLLATLARLPRIQALALFSIPSASLDAASRRGRLDLIRFRIHHTSHDVCTDPISSSDGAAGDPGNPSAGAILNRLAWTLHGRDIPSSFRPSSSPPLRIEWWQRDGFDGRGIVPASAEGHLPILRFWLGYSTRPPNRHDAMCAAARRGRVDVLEFWRREERMPVPTRLPRAASEGGAVAVLDWWAKQEDAFSSTYVHSDGVEAAAMCGRIDALRWWKRRGVGPPDVLPFRDCSEDVVVEMLRLWRDEMRDVYWGAIANRACAAGHLRVLRWLADNAVPVPWEQVDVEILATEGGFLPILQWFTLRPLRLTGTVLAAVCSGGHPEIIAFWSALGVPAELWSDRYLERAAQRGKVATFQWWKDRYYSPATTVLPPCLVDYASQFGHVPLLQWFKESCLPIRYTSAALTTACGNGHTRVLDWWKASGLELKYDAGTIINRCMYNREMLDWWWNSGLLVEWRADIGRAPANNVPGIVDALQWWLESGVDVFWTEKMFENTTARSPWQRDVGHTSKLDEVIHNGSGARRLQLLEWWRRNMPELVVQTETRFRDDYDSERWWKEWKLV